MNRIVPLPHVPARSGASGGDGAFEVGYRLTVGVTVVNAESAPHIDVLDADMASFQLILQFVDAVTQSHEIAHIQYLGTDVEMQSDESQVLHILRNVYHMVHILHANTKLVFGQPSGNIGMGMGTYIGSRKCHNPAPD